MPDKELTDYDVVLKIELDVESHKFPLWAVRNIEDYLVDAIAKFNADTTTKCSMKIAKTGSTCEKYMVECEMDDVEDYNTPYEER